MGLLIEKVKKNYYLKYTLLFVLCCLIVFFPYIISGRSFIYISETGDGWVQHYKAYIYYSEYLKSIFTNLINNHELIIPQWDFSIGEGSDIVGVFNYYVIGDPIAFLCVFVPTKYIYLFYDFAVILRLYLSGLVFSKLCFYTGKNNEFGVLAGSVAYVFCFWTFTSAVRHIYFLNPMIYMPLVIIGVERVIKNDKPYLLSIYVMFSALSNFYYFYNIVFCTVMYTAIRLLCLYKKNVKEILTSILEIFVYSLFGVLMSAIVLIPIINFYLNDSRMSLGHNKHLLYPLIYYFKLPSTFFSTTRYYWMCMGYASPVILALISTLLNWKKKTTLIFADLTVLIMVMFPIFGQAMNGFSYISNKWCFALALVVAYNLADSWDDLKNNKKIVLISSIVVGTVLALLGAHINMIVPLVICVLFALINYADIEQINMFTKNVLMLMLVVVCVGFNADNFYSTYSDGCVKKVDCGSVFEEGEAYEISKMMDEDDFYRYSGNDITLNSSVIFGTNSIDYYWSLTNPNISQYRRDLGISEYSLFNFKDYDSRSGLYALSNVKYYVVNKDYDGSIPYGFEYCKDLDNYALYKDGNVLPFGFTYKNAISYEQLLKYNIAEREEVLLKSIVLDDIDNNSLIKLDTYKVNSSIDNTDYNLIKVKDQYKFDINYQAVNDSNLYLVLEGLSYDDEKNWLNNKNTSVKFDVDSNGSHHTITYTTADDKYYNGRNNYVINLGDSINNTSTSITLFEDGKYHFDNIAIYSINHSVIDEAKRDLSGDVMENVEFLANKVSGSIELSEDKYLFLSIPFSKGWKAYADGEEVELLRANIGFSAIKLNAGTHNIELRFSTPYLKEGTIVSAISVVSFVAFVLISKRKSCGKN